MPLRLSLLMFVLASLLQAQAFAASASPAIATIDTTVKFYPFKMNRSATQMENEKGSSTYYAWLSLATALTTAAFMATVAGSNLSFILGIAGCTAAIIFYQKHKRRQGTDQQQRRKKGWNILLNVAIALTITVVTMAAVIGLVTMLGE